MVRLSTVYERVYDADSKKESQEKFFMLRGDEAYARTTVCELSASNYNDDAIDYYTVDVTADVFRGLGTSFLDLFLNDELKPNQRWNTSTNVHHFTKTGLQLPYGYKHTLYAIYRGNPQCLGSRSKVIELEYDIPSKFATGITITPTVSNSNVGLNVALTIGGSSTASGVHSRNILIYVDGVYHSTITTGANTNSATTVINSLSMGVHKITAEVEKDRLINQGSASVEVALGYTVKLQKRWGHATFVTNADNIFDVTVTDSYDNPIVGETVSFMGQTKSTGSDGVATFTVRTATAGKYKATCRGYQSNELSINPVNVTNITSMGTAIANADNVTSIWFDIEPKVPNVLIDMDGGLDSHMYSNANGRAIDTYNGTGAGIVNITGTTPNGLTSTITIYDYLYSFVAGQDFPNRRCRIVGTLKQYNTYYEFSILSGIGSALFFYNQEGLPNFPMELYMKVASPSNNIKLTFCNNGSFGESNTLNLNAGDEIVCRYNSQTSKVEAFINGTQIPLTVSIAGSNGNMINFKSSGSSNIRFSELRVLKL